MRVLIKGNLTKTEYSFSKSGSKYHRTPVIFGPGSKYYWKPMIFLSGSKYHDGSMIFGPGLFLNFQIFIFLNSRLEKYC